ncbi:unnamed protein product [Vicia faba]|uniref:Reverse transcriptase zinc-binding domain-containing protein n=1 Tax=Vicia faba TaxID=3906 RepID=A0AAV1B514_VICFA|nr:unnamed protein product [Vicia faba]
MWSKLWKVPVHNKIKEFLWRLANKILPTRDNLSKRGLKIDTYCPFCHNAIETGHHLFLHCHFAKKVWFPSSLGCRIPPLTPIVDWLENCLRSDNVFGRQLSYFVLWKIWFARNQPVFQNRVMDPKVVADAALDSLLEFNDLNHHGLKKQKVDTVWIHDPCFKDFTILQVDACCFFDGSFSLGCVIKILHGEICLATSKLESGTVNPQVAEIMALR